MVRSSQNASVLITFSFLFFRALRCMYLAVRFGLISGAQWGSISWGSARKKEDGRTVEAHRQRRSCAGLVLAGAANLFDTIFFCSNRMLTHATSSCRVARGPLGVGGCKDVPFAAAMIGT